MAKKGPADEEREAFLEAMRGVQRVASRGALPRRPRPRAPEPPPARLQVRPRGKRLEGWVDGVDPDRLERLRQGQILPGHRIDLHGLTRAEAERTLRRALVAAAADELVDSVLVIHGRGTRSQGAPVLKTALPGWLAEPELAAHILGFAPAPPRLGGDGATVVLLASR